MSKRTNTKAAVIRDGLQKRIDAVQQSYSGHVSAAESDLQILALLRQIYADLEKTLAVKPRGGGGNGGPKQSSATAPSAGKRSSRTRAAQLPPPPTEGLEGSVGIATSANEGSEVGG